MAQVGLANQHFKGAKIRAPTCFCGENHIVGVVFTHGSTSTEKFIIYMFSESVKIMKIVMIDYRLIDDRLLLDFDGSDDDVDV